MLRTVLLDRDGVINKKMPEGEYVSTWAEFHSLPGVGNAVARLNRGGVRVIVVSNQRGVAKGLYTTAIVDSIHESLQRDLAKSGAHIDAFFYCPHDKDSCRCRKPLPGLFEQALAQFPDLDPSATVMIGDSLSDIQFGKAIGVSTVLIEGTVMDRRPGWEAAANLADMQFSSLAAAVDHLLAPERRSDERESFAG